MFNVTVLKLRDIVKFLIGILLIFLVLLFIGIKYSVFMVAVTMAIYSLYAALVNMRPNEKTIGYSFKEQIVDICPSLFLSVVMAIITWSISLVDMSSLLMMVIQILVGIFVYITGSVLFKLEPFRYLVNYLKAIISNIKKKKE